VGARSAVLERGGEVGSGVEIAAFPIVTMVFQIRSFMTTVRSKPQILLPAVVNLPIRVEAQILEAACCIARSDFRY
jgi:hypothetical protein